MWINEDGTTAPQAVQSDKAVYILLDRSGSMAGGWDETLGSINSYVKKLPNDTAVYMATFESLGWNTNGGNPLSYEVVRNVQSQNWTDLSNREITPGGGTPLYDAAGKIMDQMIKDDAKGAILVVMTDGDENTSKEYKLSDVKAKLKMLEERGWPVVYLGSEFSEVVEYATGTFGINSSNAVNFTSGKRGMGMSLLNAKADSYFNEVASTYTAAASTGKSAAETRKTLAVTLENSQPMAFTEEEKQKLN